MAGHTPDSITLAPGDGDAPGTGLRSTRDRTLLSHVVDALSVTDDAFEAWCDRLATANVRLLRATVTRGGRRHGFQNTVFRVHDQYGVGVGVDDYLLELYEKDDDTGRIAELLHTSAIRSVHKYSGDPSYRSVYVHCSRLRNTIDQVGEWLSLSVTAYPELDDRTRIGFTTLADDGIGGVRIRAGDIATFVQPHRTALVTLQRTRQYAEETFRFRNPVAGSRRCGAAQSADTDDDLTSVLNREPGIVCLLFCENLQEIRQTLVAA